MTGGSLAMQIPLVPTLDVASLNVLIKNLKGALGPLGKDINLLDAKKVNAELDKVQKELSGIDQAFQKAFQSGSVEDMADQVEALLQKIKATGDEAQKSNPMEAFAKGEALMNAGEFMQGFAEKTADTKEAMKQLAAQTGATGAELNALQAAAGNVFEGGGFATMGDAIKAMATAQQQLGETLDVKGMEDFVSAAGAIGKTFDKDVNEVIGKSRTLIANFGLDGKEAGDLVAFAMREGGTGMDDVLDSMDEYSQLAKEAGFSAQEFVATLTNGVKAGARDTDKLADAMKETQIRLNAGDIGTALADIQSPISATIAGIVKAGEAGQLSVQQVMQQSAEAINTSFNAGEISEAMRSQLQVAVSGTPAEDIGADLYGRIFSQKIDTAAITSQAATAGKQIGDAMAPQNVFEQLELSAQRAFGDIAGLVGPAIGPMAQMATVAGQLGPAMTAMKIGEKASQFADFGKSVLSSIAPMFGAAGATTAQGVATTGTAVATNALKIAMLALPFVAIAAGLVGVIGLVDAFTGSTAEAIEGLNETTKASQAAREALSKTFSDTKASDDQARSVKALAEEYRNLKTDTTAEGQKRFAEVTAELAQKMPAARTAVMEFDAAGKPIASTYEVNADSVDSFADATLKANKVMREGEVAKSALHLRDMAEATAEARDQQADLASDMDDLQKVMNGIEGSVWVGEGLNLRTVSNAEEAREELLEMQAEFADLQGGIDGATAETQAMVEAFKSAGVPIEDIAEQTGLTVREIQAMATGADTASSALGDTALAAGGIFKEMGKVSTSAKGAAKSTGDIKKGAESSAAAVKKLAEEYNKVKSAADDSVQTSFAGVRAIQEARIKGEAQIRLLQTEIRNATPITAVALQSQLASLQGYQAALGDLEKDERARALEHIKEMKRLAAADQKLEIELGLVDISVEDLREEAKRVRQEIDSVLLGIVNASIADPLLQQEAEIRAALTGTLQGIDQQIADVRKRMAEAGADPLKDIQGGGELITQLIRLKGAREAEAEAAIQRLHAESQLKQLDDYRKFIDSRDALIDAATDREIAALQRSRDRITITDKKSLDEANALSLQIISLQQSKELGQILKGSDLFIRAQSDVIKARQAFNDAKTDADKKAAEDQFNLAMQNVEKTRTALIEGDRETLDALLKSDPELLRLEQLRAEKEAAIAAAGNDTERETLKNQKIGLDRSLKEHQDYLATLGAQWNDTHERIRANQEAVNEAEILTVEDHGAELFDARAAQIEREVELERQGAERKAAIVKSAVEGVLTGFAEGFTALIDAELADSLSLLERAQEEELMSEEAFNNKKLALEEEAEKKRNIIAQQQAGARLVIEAEAAAASLRQQAELLEAKKKAAEELGQSQIAAELEVELATINGQLGAKGSELTDLMGSLSGELGEAAGALFSGSGERAKEGFREFFSALAGGLQQLASAKITEVLLTAIGPGGILGLIAGFALKPLVTSLVGAILNPVLSGLLSFPTGGRFDSPTILVGDGSRLGGNDREWIFRDDQLHTIMRAVAANSSAGMNEELREIRALLAAWPTEFRADGRDMRLVTDRAQHDKMKRVRGFGAFRRAA